MDRLAGWITRYGRGASLAVLASLAVTPWLLARARIDNSIEVWVGRTSPSARRYEQFRRVYGSDEFVLIAAETDDPLSPEAQASQTKLAEALRSIEGVDQVLTLPEALKAAALRGEAEPPAPAKDPLVRNLLLGADGRTVGWMAWLTPRAHRERRRQTVAAIRNVAEAWGGGQAVHLVGPPLLNAELDAASAREAAVLLPIAAALAAAVLLGMLRRLWPVAACLAAVAATVAWTVSVMVLAGRTLNMVTLTLPPLLFVLGMAPGIHIALRFREHLATEPSPADAMRRTLRELLGPILLAALTTVAGFGSLLVAEMTPVMELGVFAAAGITASLVCNLLIVPGLLLWRPDKPKAAPSGPARRSWLAATGAQVARKRRLVAPLSLVATGLCAAGLFHIRADSNVLNFFPADARIARDYDFVSRRLTGSYTLELDATTTPADEPAVLAALGRFGQAVARRDDVARVDSYGQFKPLLERLALVERIGLAGDAPGKLRAAAARFRQVEGDAVHLRASILVRSMGQGDFYTLLNAADAEARKALPASARWDFTGVVLLLNEAQRSLVHTQIWSFGIAGGVVLVMMGVLFWSVRALLTAIPPNLLPVAGMFALMAAAGVPIDPATVMIASVAVGLAVDGTTHYLACYRRARSDADAMPDAAATALGQAGRAMVYTSLVAAAGFFVLSLAQFRPLAYFGLLSGATLLMALACDLFVTPAWAGVFRLWGKR